MTFMRQLFKAVGYLALLLLALGTTALTALVVANWHDDPLSQTALQVQQIPPTDAMQEGNGYLIMVGLSAPSDGGNPVSSAEEFGRRYLAKTLETSFKALHEPRNYDAMKDWTTFTGGEKVSRFAFHCPLRSDEDCFSWTLANKNEVLTLVQANSPLLVRYEAAAMAPQFVHPLYDIFSPLPYHAQLRSAHALMLAKAAVQWQHSAQSALDTMEIASRLRARIGNSANSFLEAMVLLGMQSAELRWISQAIGHTPIHISPHVSAQIRQLILQPSPNLDSSLQGEQQMIVGMLPSMSQKRGEKNWRGKLSDSFSRIGYLPIATVNASLEHLDQIKAIGNMPADALEAAFKSHNQVLANHHHCPYPIRLRNPLGTCTVAMNAAHYQSYFQRIHDMDGYRRLVMLQYLATAEGVRAQDMQAWLQTSPAELRNPYTLQAMQWDAATHSLVFDGKEPQRQNLEGSATYRIALPQAAP